MTLPIEKPTAILNPAIAKRNIARMAHKARRSGARFCPHFKTHQSATIGEWFRAEGVEAITVSSVDMARYFADHGWEDITIAFPVNWLEIDKINALAAQVKLHLLVESVETVEFLQKNLTSLVRVWLKIDTGYHRTGIGWQDTEALQNVARVIQRADRLALQGVLTHAGHSYGARSAGQIRAIYDQTVDRLVAVQAHLAAWGFSSVELSLGDTPCCSVIEDFSAVDEIRPGNFVFYDLMQLQAGACQWEDMAVAVACPVVARHPREQTLVLYGGAVHLSKESIPLEDGTPSYGALALPTADGWGPMIPDTFVARLSQEHGIVKTSAAFVEQVQVGDVVMILPVHACLTVHLLKRYQTLDGEIIPMAAI